MPETTEQRDACHSGGKPPAAGFPRTRLREIRRSRRLTLGKLAAAAGISASYLQKIESGKRRANLEVLHRLAEALSIPLRDLLVREDPGSMEGIPESRVEVRSLPITSTVLVQTPRQEFSEGGPADTYLILGHLWTPDRYVLRIHEDTMYPTLQPGDLVLVENRDGLTPREVEGKICTVVYDGRGMVARVFPVLRGGKEQVVLKGDNSMFPPISVERDRPFKVAGICLELISRHLS